MCLLCVCVRLHIVSECSKMADTEYNRRHDRVGQGDSDQCKKFGFQVFSRWYKLFKSFLEIGKKEDMTISWPR